MSDNYMDKFKTPDDFICFQITSHNGVISKCGLIEFARNNGIKVNSKMKMIDIYNAIRNVITLDELLDGLELHNLGVSSFFFQLKFDVTHDEVKRMARLGFIQVTGIDCFRMYGKNFKCDLYSVFDYFRLTKDEVHQFLTSNPKGTRKKKKTGE